MSASNDTRKRCFVTVGATASFHSLIKAVLTPGFLKTLHDAGYTELRVQYGKDGRQTFSDSKWQHQLEQPENSHDIEISGFDFIATGLTNEMRAAKGHAVNGLSTGHEGAVISHAGSGSILDALRINVPAIIVPNTDLMDNHQAELAEVLQEQRYAVYGKLDRLDEAIIEVEQSRSQWKQWPPVQSSPPGTGLAQVIREEMGWEG